MKEDRTTKKSITDPRAPHKQSQKKLQQLYTVINYPIDTMWRDACREWEKNISTREGRIIDTATRHAI